MSKYLKSIVVAILVSLWATAQAQCVHPNAPGPPRFWDGSRGCYVFQGTPAVGAPVYNGRMVNPYPYGVPQPVYNPAPYYGGVPQQYYGAPTGGGLSTPTIVGGVLGATVGSLAHNHRPQAIVGGTILGGILGNLLFPSGGQRVVQVAPQYYPQPMAQAVVQPVAVSGPPVPAEQQVGGTVTVARQVIRRESNCSVDGHPELQNLQALTEEQCAAVAKLATVRSTVQAPEQASVPQAVPSPVDTSRIPACVINTGTKSYRFNAVDGKKFGKEQCERYLAKLDPLPDENRMATLP